MQKKKFRFNRLHETKIKSKNLKYNFFRFDKKSVVFENAGWHFNNVMSAEKISLKLTFAHSEYANDKYSSVDVIENKIHNRKDLSKRSCLRKGKFRL